MFPWQEEESHEDFGVRAAPLWLSHLLSSLGTAALVGKQPKLQLLIPILHPCSPGNAFTPAASPSRGEAAVAGVRIAGESPCQ